MRRLIVPVLVALLSFESIQAAPNLLLTAQRLRRLKRDRERQTPRWVNFENRVKTVPDSPERGFELALYYAITKDEAWGREAVRWEKTHPCRARQSALVKNWVGEPLYSQDHGPSAPSDCVASNQGTLTKMRDALFTAAANGDVNFAENPKQVATALQAGAYRDGQELYAAVEYLSTLRNSSRIDLREQFGNFFSALPTLVLLGLKPPQVEHPDWMTHVAALALIALDPNTTGSQFLQGWAIEDRQMVQDGPGVAYELLWADPYLPGVGYQNLDPWTFEEATGTLVARADWTPESCWVRIARTETQAENCPADWEQRPANFGHLRLVPVAQKCVDVTHSPNETLILWKLPTGQKLRYDNGGGKPQTSRAAITGLWRVPVTAVGKVCLVR